jgi:hypothetical protein
MLVTSSVMLLCGYFRSNSTALNWRSG